MPMVWFPCCSILQVPKGRQSHKCGLRFIAFPWFVLMFREGESPLLRSFGPFQTRARESFAQVLIAPIRVPLKLLTGLMQSRQNPVGLLLWLHSTIQLSHNQNPVLTWSSQTVKNEEGGYPQLFLAGTAPYLPLSTRVLILAQLPPAAPLEGSAFFLGGDEPLPQGGSMGNPFFASKGDPVYTFRCRLPPWLVRCPRPQNPGKPSPTVVMLH